MRLVRNQLNKLYAEIIAFIQYRFPNNISSRVEVWRGQRNQKYGQKGADGKRQREKFGILFDNNEYVRHIHAWPNRQTLWQSDQIAFVDSNWSMKWYQNRSNEVFLVGKCWHCSKNCNNNNIRNAWLIFQGGTGWGSFLNIDKVGEICGKKWRESAKISAKMREKMSWR